MRPRLGADEHRIACSTLQDALERLVADERNVRRDGQDRSSGRVGTAVT